MNDLKFSTNTIPIINDSGRIIDKVVLPEMIWPVPRRRCGYSESGIYYKGAGIIYTGHYVNELDEHVKLVLETGSAYEKYNVIYPNLFRRFGIFTFRHQPCFSDYEGGCGKKEKNLINMVKSFELSAIEEIIDVIDLPIDNHNIYSYRMKKLKGDYHDTLRLIEYLITENYNTGWDKNIWDDIYCFGYVRDLADWFISDKFCHKLGTVYALLKDLIKKDKYLYEAIVRTLTGLEQLGDYHIVYIAAIIVKEFMPSCIPEILDLNYPTEELYRYLYDELYSGKACCHLENDSEWDEIRTVYKDKTTSNSSLAMQDLNYYRYSILKRNI